MTENEVELQRASNRANDDGATTDSSATSSNSWRERLLRMGRMLAGPLLFLLVGIALIAALGLAQRLGWISAGGTVSDSEPSAPEAAATRYICPMMCTPPLSEPGRCPVCAMELVPASSQDENGDQRSISIDPHARRVAHIRTVPAEAVPFSRHIRAVGELRYDEGNLKTIAAYVDGRLERLYADYTGAVVSKGDALALLYSPRLYSSQVELLVAKRAQSQSSRLREGENDGPPSSLYRSARERLLEFGMAEHQINAVEQAGKASSRMEIVAPIGGTVIERLAVEGEYVKTGQPICRLADLSSVWLMLELFPDDAAAVRYGQKVEAVVQSLPGRTFTGRVAFLDPMVDPKTRTVGVRVVVPNDERLLRVGDYATATIEVRISPDGIPAEKVYDPELAGKWISPRHPHVVENSPGDCRVCGIDLVPASRFGYVDEPVEAEEVLVVPRSAVLMAGNNSVVYVETEPGRFEIRRVVLGPSDDGKTVILDGLEAGEQVASSGNFLIDSQMQLAGNPSLIDPAKAEGEPAEEREPMSPEVLAALAELSPEDRALAETQEICPVTEMALGSMGTPIKVDVDGTPVFICCEGCRGELLENPDEYLGLLASREAAAKSSGGGEVSTVDVPEMPDMEFAVPETPDLDMEFDVPELPEMPETGEEVGQ